MPSLASILETAMIIAFGLSWPLSIVRSFKARSTKGKSLLFMCFIEIGYACGIAAKLINDNINLAFWFYILNFLMVGFDIILYFRNKRLEKAAENGQKPVPSIE